MTAPEHGLSRTPLLRRAVTAVTGASLRWWWWWQAVPRCAAAAARNAFGQRRYERLSADQLRGTRTSDTVFIFGSGRSLNDLTSGEWDALARHNTISFREFPRQRWIRADYHLTAEVDRLDEYARTIRQNPLYARTVFVVQSGWSAFNGNNLIGRSLLAEGARVFRFTRRSRDRDEPPSRSFDDGLVHGANSVFDAINFAVVMGWREIVLVGVDLYDKRYFWLPADQLRVYEKPGTTLTDPFFSAEPIVEMAGRWRQQLEADGIRLSVYNPRSLLAGPLPVFDRARLIPA
jgi:hypothetical protein